MKKISLWKTVKRLGFLAIGLIFCISSVNSANKDISLENIESALKLQEESSYPAFKVQYSFLVGNTELKPVNKYTYIRTKDVFFWINERWREGKILDMSKFQYNRNEDNHKSLQFDNTGKAQAGAIGKGIPSQLTIPDKLDPIFFRIAGNFLLDLVKNKQVSIAGTEQIESHKCYLLKGSIPLSPHIKDNVSIRVDPDIGFSPRQIESERIFSEEKIVNTIRFNNYREIAKGVWLPDEIETTPVKHNLKTGEREKMMRNVMKIEKASAAQVMPDEITVEIPSDVPFYDWNVNKMIYPKK